MRPTRLHTLLILTACVLAACAATPTPQATPAATPSLPAPGLTAESATATRAPDPTATALPARLVLIAPEQAGRVFETTQRAAQELGWAFEFAPASAEAIHNAAGSRATVVVVEDASLGAAMLEAARASSQTYFIGLGQPAADDLPSNVLLLGGPDDRADQAGFLAGVVAGFATTTERVAVFSDTTTPKGLNYRNGFINGVRYTCPKCRIDTIDLAGTEATEFARGEAVKYAALGADVIFAAAGPAGEAALTAAAESGARVIGAERDVYVEVFDNGAAPGGERVLASAYVELDPALLSALRAYAAGQPRSGVEALSLANEGVWLSALHNAEGVLSPLDVQDIEATRQRLAERALETGVDPPTGEMK